MSKPKVGISLAVKLGMPDFSSVNASIWAEDFVHDGESMDDTEKRLYEWVEERLDVRLNELRKDIDEEFFKSKKKK